MDATLQIKSDLISKIKESKDLKLLKAIQAIFDASEQSPYQLSVEQKEAIEIGRNQIKNGEYSTNESVMAEMREWLKKK
ncbi:MAG: hypothetical protein RI562_09520 [Salibacter sp.]|uniref:hypothetical protein n=1 Tax=Salibacter sp. TaxID=2010995 RepID=UPI0028707D2B|nr:hypothetical protein [Salibacter sp.]MDR9399290.1 hypothetical protein [Salibacter sp.]